MIRDLERLAVGRGLVFHSPVPFPQHSILAPRVAFVGAAQGWIAPLPGQCLSPNLPNAPTSLTPPPWPLFSTHETVD